MPQAIPKTDYTYTDIYGLHSFSVFTIFHEIVKLYAVYSAFVLIYLNDFAFAKVYQSMRAPSYHCEIHLGVSQNVNFGYADKTIVKEFFF